MSAGKSGLGHVLGHEITALSQLSQTRQKRREEGGTYPHPPLGGGMSRPARCSERKGRQRDMSHPLWSTQTECSTMTWCPGCSVSPSRPAILPPPLTGSWDSRGQNGNAVSVVIRPFFITPKANHP